MKLGRLLEKKISVNTYRATRGILHDPHSRKWRDESALEFHRTPLFSHWIIQRMGPFETTGGEWLQVCERDRRGVGGRWSGATLVGSHVRSKAWFKYSECLVAPTQLRPVPRGSLKGLKAMFG